MTREEVLTRLRSSDPLPSKERAELEYALWDLTPPEQRKEATDGQKDLKSTGMAIYARTVLGVSYRDASSRSLLRRAGDGATVLWEAIDRDNMAIGTACRLLREAQVVADASKRPLQEALADVMAEHGTLAVRMGKNGQVHRVRTPYSLKGPRSHTGKPKSKRDVDVTTRTFWRQIRAAFALMTRTALEGIEPHVAAQVVSELDADLKVLIDTFAGRLQRAKSRGTLAEFRKNISRKAVLEACDALVMNPPKPNQPVDLAFAKKRMRSRARVFHPDANAGKEHLRAEYQAVLDAYKTLEDYNDQLEPVTEAPSNKKGDKNESQGQQQGQQ